MTLPVLPLYYYHDHFTEMLSFVCETYGPVLTEEHRAFVARFSSLSKDAQCLFIRMVNRNGTVFNPSTFKYAEIADLFGALAELAAAGYVRGLIEKDYAAFVACLAKPVLFDGAKAAGMSDVRASWPKGKLTEYYLANLSFGTAFQRCGGEAFIALGDTEPLEFLLYLYFGKTEDDLKNFALRDLGILRTNKQRDFSARFTDADEARACFHYSRLLRPLESKSDDGLSQCRHRHSRRSCLSRPIMRPICAAAPRTRPGNVLREERRGGARDPALPLRLLGRMPRAPCPAALRGRRQGRAPKNCCAG